LVQILGAHGECSESFDFEHGSLLGQVFYTANYGGAVQLVNE